MSKLSFVLQCNKEEIDAVVLTKFTVLFYKDEVRQERNLTPYLAMALEHWRPCICSVVVMNKDGGMCTTLSQL